ncbi:hypothetical protein BST97_12290 [Nonlabens spongiae]|uniref:Heparan-alpha-glucosaminide N-acetyltransferase catalytic domain-containing protein n=1 Tax=Nonlabens spongiae TaxID=331648 RepID=A0A1W6MM87_9FLAO|nr:hypothetical protein BST97_12290 [Nonlabens spongiae]
MKPERLHFIDVIRALAIILMLEGHFIDTLLDPAYRDTGWVYDVWKYVRGMTAPTFFTITGFIFIYLLMKAREKDKDSKRIKKGVKRGLLLIALGYLLRAPFLSWMFGDYNNYFLVTDVLHILGASLLILITIYKLCAKNFTALAAVCLLGWASIFFMEPLYRDFDFSILPLAIANYFTKVNGSVFTLLPWIGYVFFGAALSYLFIVFETQKHFKKLFVVVGGVAALFLIFQSSEVLNDIYLLTDILMFKKMAYFNYLFPRLGNVLLLFTVLYSFNSQINFSLLSQIGQRTLSIYVFHFVLLYGSFTGLGLRQLIGQTLDPWQAAMGAVFFIVLISYVSLNDFGSNHFIYKKWKRWLRVYLYRFNKRLGIN